VLQIQRRDIGETVLIEVSGNNGPRRSARREDRGSAQTSAAVAQKDGQSRNVPARSLSGRGRNHIDFAVEIEVGYCDPKKSDRKAGKG
jgi:hypothetical protein